MAAYQPAAIPPAEFSVVLRGYDRFKVDALISRAAAALHDGDGEECAEVRAKLARADLPRAMRGFDTRQVDAYLHRLAEQLARRVDG